MIDTGEMFRSAWRHVGAEVLKHQRCVGYSDVLTPLHRWYCAQVHPGHDFLAVTLLARRAFIVFTPILAGADVGALEPMFPGYVFIAVNRQVEELLPRARVSGFRQFVGGGVTGQPVPVGEVEDLIQRAGADGIIRAERPIADPIDFTPGDTIQVTAGPFRALTGAVASSAVDRIHVLLSVMGREARIALPRGAVAPA